MITIFTQTCGPYLTNVYSIKQSTNDQIVIIDAAPGSFDKLKKEAEGKQVHLFLTHGHWDHICDASKFKKFFNATIYGHSDDKYWFENENQKNFVPPPYTYETIIPDVDLAKSNEITIGEISLKVIHVPGHTQGQTALYIEKSSCVFVGDTLFKETVGRTDFEGGDFTKLRNSIVSSLYTLPDNTIVYPGHEKPTTIEHEKRFNTVIRP